MRVRHVLAAAALAAASVGFALTAQAGDPPAGTPPSQKKIDHPFLTGTVGEWTVSWSGTDPSGKSLSGTSTSKITLAVGGTCLVEDYSSPDMMQSGFYGHGVMKVSGDGKTLTTWWFDSMSPEPMKLTGPLTDTSATIEGTMPEVGAMKIVLKKVEGGLDFDGTLNGQPWLTQHYRKK